MAVISELPEGVDNPHLSMDAMIKEAADAHFGGGKNAPGGLDAERNSVPGAELPKAIADVKLQSTEEFLKQLNKMPLFMTELDEEGEDGGENEALEAIKALAYEGEPWEVALNFKGQGNERFKNRIYTDAREFYTRALNVKCDRDDINLACLNNRAQCNLEMQNYRKCITDCRAAIKMDPKSEKPWFRSAKALLALDKLDEARNCIDNALLLKPDHSQIKDLAEKIKKRKGHVEKLNREREEREKRTKWEVDALRTALQARGIPTRKTSAPPDMPDEMVIKFEKERDFQSQLLFPVLLIYHCHMQTDLIAGMPETSTVGEQMAEVLSEPLPWDKDKEYVLGGVECYIETKTGGLVKVGRKVSLLEVLSGGKVEVVDGLVRLLVVPRKRNAGFVEEWKKKMKR